MYTNIRKLDGPPPSASAIRCFEMLAPVLLAFASQHSLLIRKYYHDQPMWSFHFLHPRGGFGSVQIHAALDESESCHAAISSHWWIDDLEKCQRSSLSTKSISLSGIALEKVAAVLESELSHILGLKTADLSHASRTMPRKRDNKGDYEFSEFERAQRLPS